MGRRKFSPSVAYRILGEAWDPAMSRPEPINLLDIVKWEIPDVPNARLRGIVLYILADAEGKQQWVRVLPWTQRRQLFEVLLLQDDDKSQQIMRQVYGVLDLSADAVYVVGRARLEIVGDEAKSKEGAA